MEQQLLIEWFEQHRRDLPWRRNPTPYEVWVSEVMLQQTRASVVALHYDRFLRQFPTVAALAGASQESVVKAWEGLGYYARARRLHAAAGVVVAGHGGEVPDRLEELLALPGISFYTAGAILSFGFRKRAAAVDGNVLRVWARYRGSEWLIDRTTTQQQFRDEVLAFLPEERPWVCMEALIELGATLCAPTPSCAECPLRGSCQAAAQGLQEMLPRKGLRVAVTPLLRGVAVVRCGEWVLVRRGHEGQLMEGLYEFPYWPLEEGDIPPWHGALFLGKVLGDVPLLEGSLSEQQHAFTRFRARLYPTVWRWERSMQEVPGYQWVLEASLRELPFSAGHRRILTEFLETLRG